MSRNSGGTYSISSQLRDSLLQEAQQDEDEHKNILDKRMESRIVRKNQTDRANNLKEKRLPLSDSADVNSQPPTKKRKSRWDVQAYQIPEQTRDTQKLINENLITTSDITGVKDLKFFKESDKEHFAQTLKNEAKEDLTKEEQAERSLLILLLKIKNGNTASRKLAMKHLTDKALEFGPKLIFDHVLPILLDRTLEDQERHLMIKVVDRVLYKLGPKVKAYTHQILEVVSPLLIDEDPVSRTIGRDVITNITSTCGLGNMITSIRPDIDHEDEYVRNLAARTMAIVGKALGVPSLLPFIKAVCHSTKSWRARHTGVKIIQQLAILLGIGILPHLTGMVECIRDGLTDEHIPVRIMTANTIATLAVNSYPYGIEAFNYILEPLWKGIRTHRGKVLAVFLKALGSIIPLMDPEYAAYYTEEVMRIVKREFNSPDDEMRKTVLIVLQKCCRTEGITPKYLKTEVAPEFFRTFWTRRVALDLPMNKLVIYTTVILSEKIGCSYVVEKLLTPLKDEAEPFRIMAIYAVNRVVKLASWNC